MRRNGNSAEFFHLCHHFMENVDEACIMASEGELNVVGDAKTKKSDKCVGDSQFSLTMVCSGTAAGQSGPFLFLGTRKHMKNKSLTKWKLIK
eukprot:9699628-Ditylum_brightwellii.AAC.1